ncbi:DNA helicase [Leptolinea sp. HRD-7]|nr:DNA helicase [Leptolinea sp. HRD-7]
MITNTDFLSGLNPQQKQAVTAQPGHILVLAGPGSGKTRVLTHRIAYLITQFHLPPDNILAVTFTNKAARVMESRVEDLLGEKPRGLWLGTFHAICARILRREADHLPFGSNFVIYDEDDQQSLVKTALRELNIDEKMYKAASIRGAISAAKNNMQKPEDLTSRTYREEVNLRVYQRYQELLRANNAVDFDDLLNEVVNLFEAKPEVRERYSRRFGEVLVDEFQDTNTAQYQILRHLALSGNSMFVVGDEDQSIYRWRGADYRNVQSFERDYPDCQKILLEQNYRSTQTVLDAARAVIDHNINRTPKHLFSDNGKGEKIILNDLMDDKMEADFVADTIQKNIKAKLWKGSDVAVMYRTNAQSRLLEEAFLKARLPYRLVGAQRFYGRREVKDIIAYLRLIYNPSDEVSLTRVINVPTRGIGDKSVSTLLQYAHNLKLSAGDVLSELGKLGQQSQHFSAFSGSIGIKLADFGSMLNSWRESITKGFPLTRLFQQILDDIRYEEYIDDASEEGHQRWENVLELGKIATEFDDRGLDEFLERLALVSDQDTLAEGTEAPTLLTLHAAKGLEFAVVFITGLDDGVLPHSRSLDDPEEMAEERRLLYVGITRAKERLYITRADRRSSYGGYENCTPSRFLRDIPATLVMNSGIIMPTRTSRPSMERRMENYSNWSTPSPTYGSFKPAPRQSKPPVEQRFPANCRVRHEVWGEGLVVKSVLEDGDETVDVFFDTVGFKRLIASLAKLEIVKK